MPKLQRLNSDIVGSEVNFNVWFRTGDSRALLPLKGGDRGKVLVRERGVARRVLGREEIELMDEGPPRNIMGARDQGGS